MKIIEYGSAENKSHWLAQIGKSDWSAGRFLHELLETEKIYKLCGADTKVLMLTDGDNLVSFCTFAEQDDIPAPHLHPWVGFVYTFPEYRAHRYAGRLLEHAYALAKERKDSRIYISTCEVGLYEKFGYTFLGTMKDVAGEESRIYTIDII